MTTTTEKPPTSSTARCSATVVDETIQVAQRSPNAPPCAEDACQVGVLRRITATRLCRLGLGARTDEVMLVVSELVTNALLHSSTQKITLSITAQDNMLWITVRDGKPGKPMLRTPDAQAASGRGLLIVDAVTREAGGIWGTGADGAATWCCLPLPARR
ncbi:ATP-binding protein [Streptomyces sp. enrichment culture]|uniref:ATP-binding protein n=1 Tax=Streptomyces sp. enrichment culture TaxID=1795815 RepID=UPI003F555E6E